MTSSELSSMSWVKAYKATDIERARALAWQLANASGEIGGVRARLFDPTVQARTVERDISLLSGDEKVGPHAVEILRQAILPHLGQNLTSQQIERVLRQASDALLMQSLKPESETLPSETVAPLFIDMLRMAGCADPVTDRENALARLRDPQHGFPQENGWHNVKNYPGFSHIGEEDQNGAALDVFGGQWSGSGSSQAVYMGQTDEEFLFIGSSTKLGNQRLWWDGGRFCNRISIRRVNMNETLNLSAKTVPLEVG